MATDNEKIPRIDFAHIQIHKGDMYEVQTVETTMADTETIMIGFKTPNTDKHINLVVSYTSKAGGHLEIIEAPTWTNQSGTSLAIINMNRNSSNTSGLMHDLTSTIFVAGSKVARDVTTLLTTNATTIIKDYVFASAIQKASIRELEEVILKANTQYVIRYTADGATNGGFVKIRWYEHDDLAN